MTGCLLSLHMVTGVSVGLWFLHAGREQDLHSEADSFGLEDAVSVVKPENI